jgi:hypothetical protein
MVEVFKTDVKQQGQANMLLGVLSQQFPFIQINFDLEDCDNILRIEGSDFCTGSIIELLNTNGHQCLVLD